jgi:hypothetical protein
MLLAPCSGAGCLGNPSLLADTDPVVSCAAIAAGNHPASFWYVTSYLGDEAAVVDLAAIFFQGPDCTGAHEWRSIGADVSGWGFGSWQQVTGDLNAPAGTQSAVFELRATSNVDCSDYCWPWASFDDVAVYQYA